MFYQNYKCSTIKLNKVLEACIFCIPSWLPCTVIIYSLSPLEVSGSSSAIVCHCKLCTAHKSFCHTLFIFLTHQAPLYMSLSLYFCSHFLSKLSYHANRARHIAAPKQMLAKFLISFSFSPACQFVKGGSRTENNRQNIPRV